jgi:hypothetical protein
MVRRGIGRKCETGKLDLCDWQTSLLLAWLGKGLARKSFHGNRGQPSRYLRLARLGESAGEKGVEYLGTKYMKRGKIGSHIFLHRYTTTAQEGQTARGPRK